jgi:hypothetical protein
MDLNPSPSECVKVYADLPRKTMRLLTNEHLMAFSSNRDCEFNCVSVKKMIIVIQAAKGRI